MPSAKGKWTTKIIIMIFKPTTIPAKRKTKQTSEQILASSKRRRKCTDLFCCGIFFLSVLASLICAIFGYVRGDPERLLYPSDSAGRFCGDGSMKEKPRLFFFDLLRCSTYNPSELFGCPTKQVCVATCPQSYFAYHVVEASEKRAATTGSAKQVREAGRKKLICTSDVNPVTSKETIRDLVLTEKCAAYYVPSSPVFNRCIPSIFKIVRSLEPSEPLFQYNTTLINDMGENVTFSKLAKGTLFIAEFLQLKGYAEHVMKDVVLVWRHIFTALVVVAGVCLLWILLLRCLVKPIVFFSIAAFIIIFMAGMAFSFFRYQKVSSRTDTLEVGLLDGFVSRSNQYIFFKTTWLVFGFFFLGILLIFVLIIIALHRDIEIACQVIEETSKTCCMMPVVFIWPVIPCLMLLIVVAIWLSSALYIASMGEKQYASRSSANVTELIRTRNVTELIKTKNIDAFLRQTPCNPNNVKSGQLCEFVRYGGNAFRDEMEIYQAFMVIWVMNFVVALDQMTLAGAFAAYYWSREKKWGANLELVKSFLRCVRFHLGSMAFGAFLLTVLFAVQSVLDFTIRRMKRSKRHVVVFLTKCLVLCIMCLQKLLEYLNKNAYVMIAIYGESFCPSSRKAFQLISRNITKVVVLDRITEFLLTIIKLALNGVVAVVTYLWFTGQWQLDARTIPSLNFSLVPVVIIVVGSFVVTRTFLGVFDSAIDTMFLCILEDMEMNDGSVQQPYFMSKAMFRLLIQGKGKKKPPQPQPELPAPKSQQKTLSADRKADDNVVWL